MKRERMTDPEELFGEIERVRREAEEINKYVQEREQSIRKGVRKAKTHNILAAPQR